MVVVKNIIIIIEILTMIYIYVCVCFIIIISLLIRLVYFCVLSKNKPHIY